MEKEPKIKDMEDEELLKEEARLEKEIAENERLLREEVEQRLAEMPEEKRKEVEDARKEVEKKRKAVREAEGESEKTNEKIRSKFAQISPKEFAQFVPKRFLFGKKYWLGLPLFGLEDSLGKHFKNMDFMRYATGEQYMAVMESEYLSEDEKERITKARFKFCYDWLNSPKMQEYFGEKKKYEEAYAEWLEKLAKNPDEPMPNIVKKYKRTKGPQMDIKSPLGKEVREMFRNNIRNIKELVFVNRHMPDIFDHFEIVGHMRFGMIQDIRKHEAFAGRGRKIRETKFEDFHRIISHVKERGISKGMPKKYFESFTVPQLIALRGRIGVAFNGKGGQGQEIAGGGGGVHQFPLVIDLIGKSVLQGFKGNDDEDKRNIIKHMLTAEAIEQTTNKQVLSKSNKQALKWLRSAPSGQKFYDGFHRVVEEVQEEFPDYKPEQPKENLVEGD